MRQLAKFLFTINVDDESYSKGGRYFHPEVALVDAESSEFADEADRDIVGVYHKLFRAIAARLFKGVVQLPLQEYITSLSGAPHCKKDCPSCYFLDEVVGQEAEGEFFTCRVRKPDANDKQEAEDAFTALMGFLNTLSQQRAEDDEETQVPDVFTDFISKLDNTE